MTIMKHIALCLLCLSTLAVLLASCAKGKPSIERVIETKNMLRVTAMLIDMEKSVSREEPPTTVHMLVVWMEARDSGKEVFIDYAAKTIRDSWGKEIVLIVEDGRLRGVGSCGVNGRWDGGGEDDIVAMLE
jgi:hypothetical protein